MTTDYHLSEHHIFKRIGKAVLFNVETMLFYEVMPLVYDLVTLLSNNNSDPIKSLKRKYRKAEIENAMLYLRNEGFLKKVPSNGEMPALKKRYGIRHLELMVTHGCNMGCKYCYGIYGPKDWKDATYLYGAKTKGMSFETAKKGVDFLFEESKGQNDISIIFFGGEPLLELKLIEEIIPYINDREKESGKKVNLSISTNGILLNQRVVDFLVKNKISCQVSIDGPRDIQDTNRCLSDGKGSYDLVMPGIKRLISRRQGRVPARVTVSHSNVNIPKVVEHLLSLGFGSVHIEPAIGSPGDAAVSIEDIERIKKQNEELAVFLVTMVRENRHFNYSNLVKFIRHTRVIRDRLAYYCGAGRTYFSLSQDGAFYPCHRFVGMEEYRMGDVENGMDMTLQKKILSLTVDNRLICRDCWARYLCGGGCWKHAVDINGSLAVPDNDLSCEIIRHSIECAMAINSELKVSDKDILSDLYEQTAEPYLVAEDSEYLNPKSGIKT